MRCVVIKLSLVSGLDVFDNTMRGVALIDMVVFLVISHLFGDGHHNSYNFNIIY